MTKCTVGTVHRADHELTVPKQPDGLCATDWMPMLMVEDDGVPPHLVATIKTHFVTETYIVTRRWFETILNWADVIPTVDAFADAQNTQLKRYWDVKTDAFTRSWKQEVLWMNPPFSQMERVVNKIYEDEATGIIVFPTWGRKAWFHALHRVAIKWMDIPIREWFFETADGTPLPQRKTWRTRVLVFNAFNARRNDEYPLRPVSLLPVIEEIYREFQGIPERLPYADIFSVVESASQHPMARAAVERIQIEFADVLGKPRLAKDIDPALRGPFGVARITLIPGAVPKKCKPFRMAAEKEEAMGQLIQSFLKKGWIRESNSDWAAMAFLVSKPGLNPDGSKRWRMVVDHRHLNSQITTDPYPLPVIEDLIAHQQQFSIWSVFDLEDGFHQMHLHEDDRHLTAFVCTQGQYEWNVLVMGAKNAPPTFQRMVNWVGEPTQVAKTYVDDTIVGTAGDPKESAIVEQHYRDVATLLTRFRECQLYVKGTKCFLFMLMIKFCGHILTAGSRRAAPSKLKAVEEWTPQSVKTITHLRGFLGLCQHFNIYIKNFAEIATPLTDALSGKVTKTKEVTMTDDMCQAFEQLKQAVLQNAVLQLPNPYRPYVLQADASTHAVGGMLSQEDDQGRERPVAFYSRKLQGEPGKGQMAWHIKDKEAYAVIVGLIKFRSWIASSLIHVKVLTDHSGLKYWYGENLATMIAGASRRARWHQFFSLFNLEVVYVPGATQTVADALSRWVYPPAMEDACWSLHGSTEAEAYAARCEAGLRQYDNFPDDRAAILHPVAGVYMTAALTRLHTRLRGHLTLGHAGVMPVHRKRGRGKARAGVGTRRMTGRTRKASRPLPARIHLETHPANTPWTSPWDYTGDDLADLYSDLAKGVVRHNFVLIKDKIMKGRRACPPRAHYLALMEHVHVSSGHPGPDKLTHMTGQQFYMTESRHTLHQMAVDVCHRCYICQAVKPRKGRHQPGTMDFCPVPEDIFSSLCMDFVDLPTVTGTDGRLYDYVMVIVCRLSGYIIGIPCRKLGLTAKETAWLFLRNCVLFGGLPKTIMSDNDKLLTSEWFKTLCELCGVEQHSSIIYRPQGNGRAERAVQTVVQTLRLVVQETGLHWMEALPWALFVLNGQPGVILPYSPHRIVFGRDPVAPSDIPYAGVVGASQACLTWFKELLDLRKTVHTRIMEVHTEQTQRYKAKYRVQMFEAGDRVWVRVRPAVGAKLEPLWQGPCEILDHIDKGRYSVALPEGPEDLHTADLKPYLHSLNGTQIPLRYFKPRQTPETAATTVVDRILGHRTRAGRLQWNVRWKDGSETWEFARSFVGDVEKDWLHYNKTHQIEVDLSSLPR
jgi:transposase InsO family protein